MPFMNGKGTAMARGSRKLRAEAKTSSKTLAPGHNAHQDQKRRMSSVAPSNLKTWPFFAPQLATMMKAGVPLPLQAFDIVVAATPTPA